MEKDFWISRWDENQIGFHQSAFNKNMKDHFNNSNLENKNVLIPLAGKSLDIHYFLEKKANVFAVEFSEKAVLDFFKSSDMKYQVSTDAHFTIYKSGNLTFFQGDFFEFSKHHINKVHVLYDRACVVALPFDMRQKYYKTINDLIDSESDLFILTYAHDGPLTFGPPFYVPESEINNAYKEMGHDLSFIVTKEEKADGRFKEAGMTKLKNIKWTRNI